MAAAAAAALDHAPSKADWDETAPVTHSLNRDEGTVADQFFHVEWSAAPGRDGQEWITGYVYNDFGDTALNVKLHIVGLDSTGRETMDITRPVQGTVPGNDRAYFDVHVPRSTSYRVAVTGFDFVEPEGGK